MNYSKLADLRSVFLENHTQASRGQAIIDNYLREGRNLTKLLRHHSDEEIYENETWLRDDIDYFLEYFSILGLAHFTGYLPLEELQEDRRDITYYLNIVPLKKYYYDHYPLLLPQILLEALEQNKPFRKLNRSSATGRKESLFHQFHALNQSIDNSDVNQFLWFLDNGESYNYNLDDLKHALEKTERCFKLRHREDALGESIRGFFLYLDFIQQFDTFLKIRGNELDKSAYWTYHSYWFLRIHKHLRSSINKFFDGLQDHMISIHHVEETESVSRVNASRQIYEDILLRLVFNPDYEHQFAVAVKQWRDNNSLLAIAYEH